MTRLTVLNEQKIRHLKLQLLEELLEVSKINLVRDAEKEEGVLLSLPKVRANLQLLEDVIAITGKDLDEICQQIIKEDLNQGNVNVLMSEVAELVDSSLLVANGLKVKFLELDAELREISSTSGASTPSTQSSSASDPHILHFQDLLAKELAKLQTRDKTRPASKNLNDFGYAKIQIPSFQGNMKDFTKWRHQVEDYLNETASKSTEKQAVHLLN